jgi:hypothetical protein
MRNRSKPTSAGALAVFVALCVPGVLHLLLVWVVRVALGDRESAAPLALLMYGSGAATAVCGPLAVVAGVVIAALSHRPRVVALVALLLAISQAGSFAAHYYYGFSPSALFGER